MAIEYRAIPFGDLVLPAWIAQHAERVHMAAHFPSIDRSDVFGFVAIDGCTVVGHVTAIVQPLSLPSMPFRSDSGFLEPLGVEAFVQTFCVEENHRRQGIGRRLQEMAIDEARLRGCIQLRSWSSSDRTANYRLKRSMGFAATPGFSYIDRTGQWIPGVWFVMPL